jgi:hypothetical protein
MFRLRYKYRQYASGEGAERMTPWSRVHHEMTATAQFSQENLHLYGTLKSIAVLTRIGP